MLPQSTVALRVSRNYSKVVYLKWLKSRILSFFLFFLFSFFTVKTPIKCDNSSQEWNTNKRCHAHSDMYSMAMHIIQQPSLHKVYIVEYTSSHCYLCWDGCWTMWPWYGVHITVCMSFLVYFVSQGIHWAIPTSAGFLFRNLFMESDLIVP